MKKFHADYQFLKDMYSDDYYPNFLVDKIKDEIQKVIAFLETGITDTEQIQKKFDSMTLALNDLEEAFEEYDSEIESVARDAIAVDVMEILHYFEIPLDVEDALREREW